jgi:hypothetical protein
MTPSDIFVLVEQWGLFQIGIVVNNDVSPLLSLGRLQD